MNRICHRAAIALVIGATGLTPLWSGATASAAAGGAHRPTPASSAQHGHHRHFTAVGTISDVGDGTITLDDKAGSKDLHGQSVTVAVTSTTRIKRNHARATLTDLQAGDHVAVNGMRSDAGLVARHVVAKGPRVSSPTNSDPSATS